MQKGSNEKVYQFIKFGTPAKDNPVVTEAEAEIYEIYYEHEE